MKRRMEQLINGRFEYEAPQITLSADRIEAVVKHGEDYRGEFYILTEDQRKTKGFLTSTNRRIVLGKEKFSGDTVCVPFGVDVQGLSDGETAEGEIVILGDLGEKRILVRIAVKEAGLASSKKEISRLEEFAELAKEDYRAAFSLFTDSRFERLLEGKNRKLGVLYKGLSQNPVTYQHMEEFLIASGIKEPVSLSFRQTAKAVYKIDRSIKDTIYIKKSTWGHVRMEVEIVGSFLEVDKRVVTAEDFIGSMYGMDVVILRGKVGPGRHYGKIIIKTVYQTMEFLVEVSLDNGLCQLNASVVKHLKTNLTQDYLALLMHRLTFREWEEKTGDNLEQLKEAGFVEPAMVLFESYYYYTKENLKKARELLQPFGSRKFGEDEEELLGVYLCLAKMTGLIKDAGEEIIGQLEALGRRRVDSYLLLYLLMQEKSSYWDAPAKQLYEMEKRFELGSISPFMYLEAVRLFAKDDGLLCKLSGFSVQVLRFALRYELLTEAMLQRAAYLTCHEKGFHADICNFLCRGYERYPSNEVLEAICRMLMMGDARKKENFRWYALAVEKQLRITRLYEYYIETMDGQEQSVLPQVIRMYFGYNNTLSSAKKAMVYANVIRNKNTDRTTYQNYRKNMEEFAACELQRGKINENYACIYQEFFSSPGTKPEAEALARVLFVKKVVCKNPQIRNVIVCHDELAAEEGYPCVDGTAYVSVYTPDARIVFEDEKQRRFAGTVAYTAEPLFKVEELAGVCAEHGAEELGVLLYVCRNEPELMQINEGNLKNYQKVSEMQEFTEAYRQKICRRLLAYYKKAEPNAKMETCVRQMNCESFIRADKAALLEVLVAYGLYRRAFEMLCQYGCERVPLTSLLRLASRMISETERQENEELLKLAYFVFSKGLYDETILSYLKDYYFGNADELYAVWEKAKGFGVESYALEEKLLMLMMFTRRYLPQGARVLKSYVQGRGRELVIASYLTFEAGSYFLDGKVKDRIIFECIENLLLQGRELELVCRLALLKYYSGCRKLTKEQNSLTRKLLLEMAGRNLRFAFYQKLPGEYQKVYQLEDKIFLEQRFKPNAKVTLHYRLGDSEKTYKSELMKNMYQGLFVKEFLLFYGETLTCYMTVEERGESFETPKQQITMRKINSVGGSSYQLLNRMLEACALGDKEVLQEAADAYLLRKKLADEMLEMLE